MPLSPHTRLGPYEIIAALGAGGMGEVYRARDTRLDRTVAIKILPEHISAKPQARERFEREARAVSSLNHPHICTLYDIGHQDGVDYLVMEYLEGETLAQRIKKGPLPTEQVLQYAIHITDALDTAHRHGVIHRDLKPGNIMLTKTGAKLLDFGLAKVLAAEAGAGVTSLATQTTPLTGEGTILGTLQYMAPEQLEGKEADARTDIFALGEVVYEMATGRRAFAGKSQASLITAIMSQEPKPLTTVHVLSGWPQSAVLEHVIRRCLAKRPDDRWQNAQDVAAELHWIVEGGLETGIGTHLTPRRTRREVVAWVFGGAASLVAAGLAEMRLRERPVALHPIQFQIALPAKMTFDFGHVPALSSDGRHLVFPGTIEAKTLLWLRSFDSSTMQPLPGTDDASFPFWSPDSRFIGFFADAKLKKIDVAGGVIQDLCQTGQGFGGTWNKKGLIVFSPGPGLGLRRITADNCAPAVPVGSDRLGAENIAFWPSFLPDGRHFLYQSGGRQKPAIYLASFDSGVTRSLLPGATQAIYAPPGFLIFQLNDVLLTQPFDARTLRLTGEATRLASGVSCFSASDNGLLAYRGADLPALQLAWYNRDGKRLGSVGEPGEYTQIVLSPDEKRLAIERRWSGSATELWLLDLATGIFSRLTFQDGNDPVWSPDGRQLIFSSNRKGTFDLYRKVIGGGEQQPLFASAEPKYPEEWSGDGKFLIFINENGRSFYRMALTGEPKPELLLRTEFDKDEPHLSPDGRWIAYGSDESGRWEVYAASFPSFAEKRQVSNAGGGRPTWRVDGRELFYLSLDAKMMAVEVKIGSTLVTGMPRTLFQTPIRAVDPREDQYCATNDGHRFLIGEPLEQSTSAITVVVNWTAMMKH